MADARLVNVEVECGQRETIHAYDENHQKVTYQVLAVAPHGVRPPDEVVEIKTFGPVAPTIKRVVPVVPVVPIVPAAPTAAEMAKSDAPRDSKSL